jgi:hypothetical protein
LLFLIILFVIISTAGGVVYAILEEDVSAGLAIGSYAIALFGVAGAVWGAGEHFGVEKPGMYSYSFDTVYKYDVQDDAKDVK